MSYCLTTYPIRRPSVRKSYRPLLRVLRLEPLPSHRRSYERRVYAHAEPLPLEIVGRRKVVAYACGHCGSVKSLKPGLYNSGPDSAWRQALECCRRPNACASCGTPVDQHKHTCEQCWQVKRYREDRALARKAKIIGDTREPVCDPLWQGEWGDGYSPTLADHMDWWQDEHGTPEGEPVPDDAPEPPAFVYATTPVVPTIDIDQICEHLTEEMHEDATVDDLYGFDILAAAIEAFNKAQSGTSWMIDYSRVIVIDPVRFAAYLGTDWDGTPDIRWRERGNVDQPTQSSPLRLRAPAGAPGAATSEVPG